MSYIEPLSKVDFDQLLASTETYALLDFHASWCGPCQMMKPILENLSQDEDIKSKITIYSVDVDSEPELSQEFSVRSIPAFKLIKTNGTKDYELVHAWVGAMDKHGTKMTILKALDEAAK
jgi:thioredoxin 1